MNVNDFDFNLPSQCIARYPLKQRSASRLMILSRSTDYLQHHYFSALPTLLTEKDLLIMNDTRVIPARLYGKKSTGGALEILIERIIDPQHALAHIKASKPLHPGSVFFLEDDTPVQMRERQEDLFLLQFQSDRSVIEILRQIGHIPLPPYLNRADELLDQTRYQTVYAKKEGAVAAPTAGLHFDESLMQTLQKKSVEIEFITLHVGAGTFQPVRVDNIHAHKMHSEYCEISAALCEKIKQCKAKGGRIIAVGTTVVRTLETAAKTGQIKPFQGETDIFIHPPYQFQCVDAMITNFHLPQSTLLMLVCAFAGHARVMQAYEEAIRQNYRFFSYGDAMFLC